jgi:hypothetical protein
VALPVLAPLELLEKHARTVLRSEDDYRTSRSPFKRAGLAYMPIPPDRCSREPNSGRIDRKRLEDYREIVRTVELGLSGSDVTDAPVAFEGGADLGALRGKKVRLEFVLTRAKFYAFSVGGATANDAGKRP